jgi:hypothetical protein
MVSPENNIIYLQTSKEITSLFKSFLEDLENQKKDHDLMMAKVAEKCGQDYANSINFFSDEKYNHIRKRVLDHGNETSRQLSAFLDYFDFQINTQKLDEAVKNKVTHKKIIIAGQIGVE